MTSRYISIAQFLDNRSFMDPYTYIHGIILSIHFQDKSVRYLIQDIQHHDQCIFLTLSPKYAKLFSFCQVEDQWQIGEPLAIHPNLLAIDIDKLELQSTEHMQYYPHVSIQESNHVIPNRIQVLLSRCNYEKIAKYDKVNDTVCLIDINNPLTNTPHKHYNYTCIYQLVPHNTFNIWAVVTHYQQHKPCKNNNYIMKITLMDDEAEPFTLFVNLFQSSPLHFPHIKKIGDVIRFHRIMVQTYDNILQAINYKGSAFLLFDGDLHGSLEPYEESINDKTGAPQDHSPVTNQDILTLLKLRSWYHYRYKPLHSVTQDNLSSNNNYLKTTSDLDQECYFSYVAEVVRIFPRTHSDQITLLLTDYTVNELLRIVGDGFNVTHLPRIYLLCTVWDEHVNIACQLVPGQYILIKNVKSRFIDGELIAILHGGMPSIQQLNNDHSAIHQLISRKKQFMERFPILDTLIPEQIDQNIQETKRQRISLEITRHSHKNIPLTTLYDIENFNCPFKFRCQIRIIGFFPALIERFSKPFCMECQYSIENDLVSCEKNLNHSIIWRYAFGLICSDSSGKLPLLFYGNDATNFLGIDPVDFSKHSLELERLRQKIGSIMSSIDRKDGPLLDICIQSYYKKGSVSRSNNDKRYSILDTRLL